MADIPEPVRIALEDVTPMIAAAFADDACLIWSGEHRAYWVAGGNGYTTGAAYAGRWTIADAYRQTKHCDPTKQIAFERVDFTRAAPPAMDREAVERKFWLIIREPGRVPDRKGPWPLEQTASILREFMAANPKSFIDYLTIGPDGSPYVDHGPEVLQMTDGRSMSVGRKHNARVREAAIAALSTLSADAIRQGEGMEERPFAHCCAEAGGRIETCDCANKNHGTAWFSTPASHASDGGKA